jgi:hypothetical protein
MAKLIVGAGSTVDAQWDADIYAGIFGSTACVLAVGNKLALSIVDNNTVRAADGVIVAEGRAIIVESGSYEEFKIPTGTAGKTATYYIGWTITWRQGVNAISQYVSTTKPNAASLRSGATSMTVVLGTVNLNGITIAGVQRTAGVASLMSDCLTPGGFSSQYEAEWSSGIIKIYNAYNSQNYLRLYLRKVGHIVGCNLDCMASMSDLGATISEISIPEKFRPVRDARAIAPHVTNGRIYQAGFTAWAVTQDGKLTFMMTADNTSFLDRSVSFAWTTNS